MLVVYVSVLPPRGALVPRVMEMLTLLAVVLPAT